MKIINLLTNEYNMVREKIKNLQRSIVQRAIIKEAYILNDAKNYIDLIYNYSFLLLLLTHIT